MINSCLSALSYSLFHFQLSPFFFLFKFILPLFFWFYIILPLLQFLLTYVLSPFFRPVLYIFSFRLFRLLPGPFLFVLLFRVFNYLITCLSSVFLCLVHCEAFFICLSPSLPHPHQLRHLFIVLLSLFLIQSSFRFSESSSVS